MYCTILYSNPNGYHQCSQFFSGVHFASYDICVSVSKDLLGLGFNLQIRTLYIE